MKKTVGALFLGSLTLFAFTDSDMDGVEDVVDKCPNTPIMDLVDANGCTIKSLIVDESFDIVLGLSYSEMNYRLNENTDTYTMSFQADYYRDDFSLQFSTSYYTSSDSVGYDSNGMNDTTIAAYYRFKPLPSLRIDGGIGVILPTYESDLGNNNTDYTLSLNGSYSIKKINLFAGYRYTLIGDDDIDDGTTAVSYRNTYAYSFGTGYYFTSSLYSSISYYRSDSIYRDVEAIRNISIYIFYSVDSHRFVTLNYARGLSDSTSDSYLALRIGYYF